MTTKRRKSAEVSLDEWIDRTVATRGKQEHLFWQQAATLKKLLAGVKPASAKDQVCIERVKIAVLEANSAYAFDDDLTRALEHQRKAHRILAKILKPGRKERA